MGVGSTAGNTIDIYGLDGNIIGTGKVDDANNFSVSINEGVTLKAGDVLQIEETDGKIASERVSITVDEKLVAPTVGLVIDEDKAITGTGSFDGNTISVYGTDNKVIGTGKVSSDKTFVAELNERVTLNVGDTLQIEETNGTHTSEKMSIIVVGKLAASVVSSVTDQDKIITGTGTAANNIRCAYRLD